MIIERRLQPVRPFQLALSTQPFRYGLHGLGQPSIDPSVFTPDQLGNSVNSFVGYWMSGKVGQSGAPVPVQNQVGMVMNNIAQAYYAVRASGNLTINLVQAYQNAFSQIISSFCQYANGLNTARGQAGCQTIAQVGNAWIQGREVEKAGLPLGGSVAPIQIGPSGTSYVSTTVPTTSALSSLPLIGIVALAWYALKGRF